MFSNDVRYEFALMAGSPANSQLDELDSVAGLGQLTAARKLGSHLDFSCADRAVGTSFNRLSRR